MTQLVIIDKEGAKCMTIDGAHADPATLDRQFRDKETALVSFDSKLIGKGTALLIRENITALLFIADGVDI